MNIYISNLSSDFGNEELTQLFSRFGTVKSAAIVADVFTGGSRGFGYVEMEDNAAGQKAIEGLDKTELNKLILSVKEAESKHIQRGSYKVGNGAVDVYKFRKN